MLKLNVCTRVHIILCTCIVPLYCHDNWTLVQYSKRNLSYNVVAYTS